MSPDGSERHLQALSAFDVQLKALLAMAPARRYRAKALPTHRHGLTLDGQLDLHTKPLGDRVPIPLPPASTNKEIRLFLHYLCTGDACRRAPSVLSCACVARSARFFARFVVILACISSDLWTDTVSLKPRSRKLLAARNPNTGSRPPSLSLAGPLQEGAWGVCGVDFEPILSPGIYRSVCGMIHGVLILRYFEPRC